jgi:dephospho-CoA kinase
MARPLAVALTGGIGAGKSEALASFARRGVPTSSSDVLVHRLYEEDAEVREALRARYGDGVLDEAGRVERKAVAERVFGEPDELRWLEQLVHPRVQRQYDRWRTELATQENPPALCVTEIPLLYETGGETRFDAVIAITAPAELRHARTLKPRQAEREARLLPDEEKLRRADYAYVNDGTIEELDRFVERVLRELAARAD